MKGKNQKRKARNKQKQIMKPRAELTIKIY